MASTVLLTNELQQGDCLVRGSCPSFDLVLIALDVAVDGAHKHGSTHVANSSTHECQANAEHGGVPKVEACLEET